MWWRRKAHGSTATTEVVTKRIVVLANSFKHGARCIAGREVIGNVSGDIDVGPWVRPVSSTGEGELQPDHYRIKRGGYAEVLDIVDVPCIRRDDDPVQPENWVIDPALGWTRVGRFPESGVARLAENPDRLWPSSRQTDRVAAAFLHQYPPGQSLYLIRIQRATIVPDTRSGFRLRFRYNGIDYALKITDPRLSSRYGFALYDEGGVPLKDVHACLSLGSSFNGFHYKLVATLFP